MTSTHSSSKIVTRFGGKAAKRPRTERFAPAPMTGRSTSAASVAPRTQEQQLAWLIAQYAPIHMANIGYNALWLPVLREKVMGYVARSPRVEAMTRFPPPGGRKSPQDPLRRVSFAPEGALGGTP